jgi:hypothetical protein
MFTRAKANRRTPRRLLEQFQVGAGARTGSPLEIDEDAGVIKRVKVLGRFSRNNHGMAEAENGTEYSPECMRKALPDYEGRKVKCNHPASRAEPGKDRPIEDTFGVLRDCVIESDEHGEPAIWADLHCLQTHPMYPRVVEDVQKGLGVYGLSHNASAARDRFDRATKRLVIEELAQVRSVDLVDKPATNRNLWESERITMPTTFRQILESYKPKLSKPGQKWVKNILEDDMMAPAMDAPVEAEGDEPEDALWSGFQAAIQKVLDCYKSGECDVKEAGKKIQDWLKAHDKLTGSDEPEAPDDGEVQEQVGDGSSNQKAQKGAMEFFDADPRKSRHESEEVRTLRAEKGARVLCEALGFAPTELQVEAIAGIGDPKRKRELAESYKPVGTKPGGGFRPPRAAAPGAIKPPAGKAGASARETQESEVVPAADAHRTLMGD